MLTILDIYDRMQKAMDAGQPYQTVLDPPPADPRVAHEVCVSNFFVSATEDAMQALG